LFIIEADRIEYIAAEPSIVTSELNKLFEDIELLVSKKDDLDVIEVFYYSSLIHLVFVKIHPFQDGNGRTSRLIEKWFLISCLGKDASGIELEKNYYTNRRAYYKNIREIGLEYNRLDYSRCLKFLLMTIMSLKNSR